MDRLDGATRWFKVGLELYIAEGNSLVAELQRRGFSIFLDLKLHDIPNTVASAVRAATRLGVEYADRACRRRTGNADRRGGSSRRGLALLAVTVLTSMDGAQLEATGVPGTAAAQVERLATMAFACGVAGIRLLPSRGGQFAQPAGQRTIARDPGDSSRGRSDGRSTAGGYSGGRHGIRGKLPGGRAADYPGC